MKFKKTSKIYFEAGDEIRYFEYLDHGIVSDLSTIDKNRLILVCTGKIIRENNDYYAVITSGVKNRDPSSAPTFELILKDAIIKNKIVYEVKDNE